MRVTTSGGIAPGRHLGAASLTLYAGGQLVTGSPTAPEVRMLPVGMVARVRADLAAALAVAPAAPGAPEPDRTSAVASGTLDGRAWREALDPADTSAGAGRGARISAVLAELRDPARLTAAGAGPVETLKVERLALAAVPVRSGAGTASGGQAWPADVVRLAELPPPPSCRVVGGPGGGPGVAALAARLVRAPGAAIWRDGDVSARVLWRVALPEESGCG